MENSSIGKVWTLQIGKNFYKDGFFISTFTGIILRIIYQINSID